MASPAPDGGGGGRILGLPRRTVFIGGGVVLAAALGYMLWRRRQASKTAAPSSASASSSTTGAYGVDYGGELSVLQSELEGLLAAEGQDSTGTGGGTGPGSNPHNCPGGFTWDPVQGRCVAGKGEQGNPGTGGGTKAKPGIPTGVHPTKTTPTAVTLGWNKAPNATSYRVRATYQGKLVGGEHSVNGTAATVSGLHPDHTYTFHVASAGPGGESAETNGPAVKTGK